MKLTIDNLKPLDEFIIDDVKYYFIAIDPKMIAPKITWCRKITEHATSIYKSFTFQFIEQNVTSWKRDGKELLHVEPRYYASTESAGVLYEHKSAVYMVELSPLKKQLEPCQTSTVNITNIEEITQNTPAETKHISMELQGYVLCGDHCIGGQRIVYTPEGGVDYWEDCQNCNGKGWIKQAEPLEPVFDLENPVIALINFCLYDAVDLLKQPKHHKLYKLATMYGLKKALADESEKEKWSFYVSYDRTIKEWMRYRLLHCDSDMIPFESEENAEKVAEYMNEHFPSGWEVTK